MQAIIVKELTIHHGSQLCISNLSFELEQGNRLAIIGPNGAGKTTILQGLLKLIPASFSSITYLDQSINSLTRRALSQLVAYVPQFHTTLTITVWEWCLYSRFPYQKLGFLLTIEEQELIEYVLNKTGLIKYRDTELDKLSGGERQRVFIAGALCQETPIIFLDEPTNFLDRKQAHALLSIIVSSSKELNKTIISVTHDINEVSHYYTHCLAVKKGEKLFYGSSSEVINPHNLYHLYDHEFIVGSNVKGDIFW